MYITFLMFVTGSQLDICIRR